MREGFVQSTNINGNNYSIIKNEFKFNSLTKKQMKKKKKVSFVRTLKAFTQFDSSTYFTCFTVFFSVHLQTISQQFINPSKMKKKEVRRIKITRKKQKIIKITE